MSYTNIIKTEKCHLLKELSSFYLVVNNRKIKKKIIEDKLNVLDNKHVLKIAKYILNKNIVIDKKNKTISYWLIFENLIQETIYFVKDESSGYQMIFKKIKLFKL